MVEENIKNKVEEDKSYHTFNTEESLDKLREIVEELPADKIRHALQGINQVDEDRFHTLTDHIAKTHPEKLI